MDIGQPADFIKAGELYLGYLNKKEEQKMLKGDNIVGTVLADPSAKISKTAKIGPNVIIGKNCVIGDGTRLKNVCIMPNSSVGSNSYVINTLIGWSSKIGNWCRVEGMTVFGEDVILKDELYINGAIILPHKCVTENVRTPGTILL